MAVRSLLSIAGPVRSQRAPSHDEGVGFAQSETRLKQARREPEDVEADIQASLLAAFDQLDELEQLDELDEPGELDSQPQGALSRNLPATPPALPRVPGASKLPAHMPPLPASQPHIFVAKRKVTPPPLPLSALAPAPAAATGSAPILASNGAPRLAAMAAPAQSASSVRPSPARRSRWIARVMLVLCAALALAAVAIAFWPGFHGLRLESLNPALFRSLRSL